MASPQPIDVHFWPTPNGRKITIALEEMELPYRLIPVNIGKDDQFKPESLAISPNNRMPAIVDPEGPDDRSISLALTYNTKEAEEARRILFGQKARI